MLILASQSASRRAMLDAAGVTYTACPADLDERAIEAGRAWGVVHQGLWFEIGTPASIPQAEAILADG